MLWIVIDSILNQGTHLITLTIQIPHNTKQNENATKQERVAEYEDGIDRVQSHSKFESEIIVDDCPLLELKLEQID